MHERAAPQDDARRIAHVERLVALVGRHGHAALQRVVRLATRATDSPTAVIAMVGATCTTVAQVHHTPDLPGQTTRAAANLHALHERVLTLPLDPTGAPVVLALDAVEIDGADTCFAYLGVPLWASCGDALGVLAVCAHAPRAWTAADIEALADLSALALAAFDAMDLRHDIAHADMRFADLVNGLDAIVWEADVQAQYFSFISRHAETLLGYPTSMWLDEPDTWARLIHPDDQDQTVAYCKAAVNACEDHAFDYRVIAADGRVVWLHDRVFVEHRDGVPTRLRGVMVDITAAREAELIVRASEARLAALVAHAADIVAILNADLSIRWISPAIEYMVGASAELVVGSDALGWVHADDRAAVHAQFQRVAQQAGSVDTLTYRARHEQGEQRWVEATATNLLHDPAVAGIVCNVRDITAWVLARDEREHRERQLRTIIESSYDVISRFDRDLRHVFANQATTRTTGFENEHFIGKRLDELDWPPALAEYVSSSVQQVFRTGDALQIEFERDLPGGTVVFACQLLPERSINGTVETVLAILRDITADRRHADALQHQVFHDHLTGLPNRMLLSERIEGASRAAAHTGEAFALLFIDLDGFKHVNDTWGHAVGDALLSEVAQRLRDSVRKNDTAARLAGDEFAVVLAGTATVATAVRRAERLLECLREPMVMQGTEVSVTPSIGIVLGVAGDDSEDLLRRADTAMYEAKRAGRDRIYLEPTPRQTGSERCAD